jgi:FkbM family methyltransferase
MKPVYYSRLARAGLIFSNYAFAPLRGFLGRGHLLGPIGHQARRLGAKLLLPERCAWVQVESGLARGVWLHLKLKDEAGYWFGNYDARMQNLLKKFCLPGSVFYDIGSNLGFFSLAVAQATRPNGKVIGFEPEPENCVRFKEMVIRNDLQDRVELVEAAVWSYTSTAGVLFKRGVRPRAHGGILADGVSPVLAEGETVMVPSVSLDDFMRKGGPVPDVVKIDVEGGECEVLKGAAELFSRAKPILICEVHREEAAQWIAGWLARTGYSVEWHVPVEFYPRLVVAQAGQARHLGRSFMHA